MPDLFSVLTKYDSIPFTAIRFSWATAIPPAFKYDVYVLPWGSDTGDHCSFTMSGICYTTVEGIAIDAMINSCDLLVSIHFTWKLMSVMRCRTCWK